MDIDWAEIVDTLASEYGWTVEYIRTLDFGQIVSLKNQIYKRYEAQNGENTENTEKSITGKVDDTQSQEEFARYLEKSAGAKRNVREDGSIEIVL